LECPYPKWNGPIKNGPGLVKWPPLSRAKKFPFLKLRFWENLKKALIKGTNESRVKNKLRNCPPKLFRMRPIKATNPFVNKSLGNLPKN